MKPRNKQTPAQDQGHSENPKSALRFVKVGECLYRHRSSKVYYAFFKRVGSYVRKSLKTDDREMANRKLKDLRAQVSHGQATPEKKKIGFSQFADSWLATLKPFLKHHSFLRREGVTKNLKRHFANAPLVQVTHAQCEQWATERAPEISASSFNKEREALINIFQAAQKQHLIIENPARQLSRKRMEKKHIVIPTRKQFSDLIATFRQNDNRYGNAANLCELLAYSGMRLAEATNLRWREIDFEKDRFTVTGGEQGTKNLKSRTVPLFPSLKSLLLRIRESSGIDTGCVSPISTAKKAITSVCAQTGIPRFTHHSLRHYFCSNAIEAGVDFKPIAAWLGHEDGGILVAKTYGHLRDTHSNEMAKRMVFEA